MRRKKGPAPVSSGGTLSTYQLGPVGAYLEDGLLQVNPVARPVDGVDRANLSLDVVRALDDHDLVVGRDVPERHAVLDAHELGRRAEVGRNRHRELAALDRRRVEVRERALERLGEVARGHLGAGREGRRRGCKGAGVGRGAGLGGRGKGDSRWRVVVRSSLRVGFGLGWRGVVWSRALGRWP